MITDALTEPGGTSGWAAIAGGGVSSGIKRKKKLGRPFKKRPPRNPLGGLRKVKQTDSEATPATPSPSTPAAPSPSTTGIKIPCGRPRKDQQPSQAASSPDPTPARRIETAETQTGHRSPMLTENPPPATMSGDDASMRTKRLLARQAREAPPAATPAPKTGIKRGRGRPRKDKPAAPMSAQAGGATSTGIKSRGGRPRKKKSAAAMSAEAGGDASTGIKSRRGRPRKDKSAAAMSAEAGGDASTGIKRRRGRPRKNESAATYPYQESSSGDHRWTEHVERQSGVGSQPLPGETDQHLGDAEMEGNTGNGDNTQADPPYLEPRTVALVPSQACLQMSKEVEAEANPVIQSAQPAVAPAQLLQREAEQVDCSDRTPAQTSSGDHGRNEDVEQHSGVGSAEPLPGEIEQHLGDAEMEVNTGNGDNTQADPPYLEPQTVAPVPSEASLQISKEVEAEANLVMQSAQPIVAPARPLERRAEQVDRSGITSPQTLQPEMQPPACREACTQTYLIIQSSQPSTVPNGLSQRDAEQASLSRVPSSQCLSSAMHSSVPPSSILLERAHPDQCQPPSHQPEAAPGSSPQLFPVAPIMFNHPPVGDDPSKNELHRLRLHIHSTHQLKKSQLRTECSQEMEKLKQKYDLLLREQESTHLQQTKTLGNLCGKVLLNQSLAEDLRAKFVSSGEQVRAPGPPNHHTPHWIASQQVPMRPSAVASPTTSSSAGRPPVLIHHIQPLQVDGPSPSSSPSSQVVRPHPSILSNIVRSTSTSFSLVSVLPQGSFGVQSELAHAHAPRLQHRLLAQAHSMASANQQQLPTGLESMFARTWSTPVTPINIRQSCPHAVPPGNPSLSSLHPSSHSTIPLGPSSSHQIHQVPPLPSSSQATVLAPVGPSSSHQIQQVPPLPSSSQATVLAPVGPSSSYQIQQVPPLPSSSQPTRLPLPLPVPSNPNPVLPLTLPRGLTTTSSVSSAASSVLPSKGVGPCAPDSPQSDSDAESLDQFLTSIGVPSDPRGVAAPEVICLSDDEETDDQTKQETPLVAEVPQQKVPCKFLVKGDACKQEILMPRSIL
ncbi:hypothetical protein CFC21_075226 [Triticum aestivum]|uniref:Uncharacterized protein n=2 Tax=Triticum aestivum TaxID=4565 RepID=A0A3B6LZ05_WHEAT|nr:flocculation protein FLO11-like isoform X1 [Triticum aestivum]KAF7069618.1 hypothetical protein CFC21_075226 [Triticum aestivum]